MLLDSNIIIYAIQPDFSQLRELIAEHSPAVSAVSYVEVLGYHQLTAEDKQDFVDFFDAAEILSISQPVLDKATDLRQKRRMSLGDSIIAATAILNNLTLVTANTKDFTWIPDLNLLNPLENSLDTGQQSASDEVSQ